MILLLVILQSAFALQKVDFESGFRAETNAFYRDQNEEADVAFFIKPDVYLSKEGKKISAEAEVNTEYGKYLSFDELTYLDYAATLGLRYKSSKTKTWSSSLKHELITEPSQIANGELFERQITTLNLGLHSKTSDLTNYYLNAYTNLYNYNDSAYNYMVGQRMGLDYEYEYFFLPETAFLLQFNADMVNYPDGRKTKDIDPGSSDFLNNSVGYKLAAGFEGRMSEHSFFYFTFGYYVRQYEFSSGFNEPVFEVSFQEQITPQDTLIAGYIYKVEDSFYTNYELFQQMYLAYSKVFGDRFILLFKSNYLYKSYSKPERREDQKLYGTVQLDFSYRPNWLIKAGFSGDILISDSFNQDTTNINIGDPGASFQAYQLYIATKIFF